MTEVKTRANVLLQEVSGPTLEEIGGVLRELGVSGYAADAFCALARFPEATAGDLVRATGIPDSKIYYALDELADKGLAEVQEGKPKTYRVVPPREVQARLERIVETRWEKERTAVARLVSRLEPLRAATKSPAMDLAYIVKGDLNVHARAASLVASARKEAVLLTSDEAFLRKLEPELSKAVRRRVAVKLALPDVELGEDLARRAEIRSIVCTCMILVVDGMQVLTVNRTADGSLYGILSTDETLVRLGMEYWESPRCSVPCG